MGSSARHRSPSVKAVVVSIAGVLDGCADGFVCADQHIRYKISVQGVAPIDFAQVAYIV
jgi:hypothetical protein